MEQVRMTVVIMTINVKSYLANGRLVQVSSS